ncbi:MAG: hypothetical protein Q9216_001909 [Gyalolechia sp. 2 TL-2023]
MPPKYPADDRKKRALTRIEAHGFTITDLFLPWNTGETSQLNSDLGVNTLSYVEEIVTTLVRRHHNRADIIAEFRELYPLPKRPTKGPLQQLAKRLKDEPARVASAPPISASINSSHDPQTPVDQNPFDDHSTVSIELARGVQDPSQHFSVDDTSTFEPPSPANQTESGGSPGSLINENNVSSTTDHASPGPTDRSLGPDHYLVLEDNNSFLHYSPSERSISSRSSHADRHTASFSEPADDDDGAGFLPLFFDSPATMNGHSNRIRKAVADPKNPLSTGKVTASLSDDACKRAKHLSTDEFLHDRRAKRVKMANSVRKLKNCYEDSIKSMAVHEGKFFENRPFSNSTIIEHIDSIPGDKVDEIIKQEKKQIADFEQRAEQYFVSRHQRINHLEQLVKLQRKLQKTEAGLAGLESLRESGLLGDSSDEGGNEEENSEAEDMHLPA